MLSAQDPAEINAVLASLEQVAPARQQAARASGEQTRRATTAGAFTLAPSPQEQMPVEDDRGLSAMPMEMQ